MFVREIMERNIKTVSPDTSILEAAVLMRDGDFGVLPVCENDRIVGMITDRDISVRAVAEGHDVRSCMVRDVMTNEVLACTEDSDISEVQRIMSERQVRRIPVIDVDKRLVGIVSIGDLARDDQANQHAESALSEISQPTHREPSTGRTLSYFMPRATTSGTMTSTSSSMNPTLMSFIGGVAIGSLLTLFLEPVQGARRRAFVREKGSKLATNSRDLTTRVSRGIKNRATGLVAQTRRFTGKDDQIMDATSSDLETQNVAKHDSSLEEGRSLIQ